MNNANTALSKKNAEIADAQAAVNDAKAKLDSDNSASAAANKELADAKAQLTAFTNEKSELEAKQTAAQTSKDAADKAVTDAQAEVDTASQQLAEKDSSLEYFKSLGDNGKYAVELINKAISDPTSFEDATRSLSDSNRKILAEKGSTKIGDSSDATALENMLDALDYIDKCNEIRESNGLSELKVSPYLMAAAQVNSNIEAASFKLENENSDLGISAYHYMFYLDAYRYDGTSYYGTAYAENADWNWEGTVDAAYKAWYTDEKAVYDYIRDHFCHKNGDTYVTEDGIPTNEESAVYWAYRDLTSDQKDQIVQALGLYGPAWVQIGHYTNLIEKYHDYTGVGVNQRYKMYTGIDDTGTVVGACTTATQDFGSDESWLSEDTNTMSNTGLMTTDEMRASIQSYRATLQSYRDELAAKQEALQKAKEAQTALEAQLNAAVQAVANVQAEIDTQTQAVADKQANADSLAAVAKQSAKELADKETALSQMNNASETKAVNDAAAALAKAKTEAAAAKQAVTDAQNKVTAAEANVTSATDARNKAQANRNALKTDLNTAKAAYDAAQTKAAASKKVYEDARADLSNEQSKLDELKKAAEKAKKEVEQANAAVTEKTDAYKKAQNAQSSAEKTLKEATASHQKAVDARNKANEESKKLTALQNELTGLNKVVEKASTEYEAARKVKESAADRLAKAKALANK